MPLDPLLSPPPPQIHFSEPEITPSNLQDPASDLDEGEVGEEDVEIDEISDDEDDRRAHELLHQAVPVRMGNSPITLPYDNRDFVVGFILPSI